MVGTLIKSPLRYPGGKSRAVNLIATLVPSFDEFREPFLGGGSVYLYLKQKFPEKKFWINDLYRELFSFWTISQKDVESMVAFIRRWRKKMPHGKDLHQFLTEHASGFSETERAAAFFIFNRITFSGTTESGGFSMQAFRDRFTDSSIERLTPFSRTIQKTKITNLDYELLTGEKGKNIFIFLDPPYYSAEKSALYGKNGHLHRKFDHVRFAEAMKRCEHQWLITYDDSEYIRNLFSFARITEYNLTYGMRNVSPGSNQRSREILISNYMK